MQLSWGRGFFRIWTVLAIVWVLFFGWRDFSEHRWSTDPLVQVGGECWDHLAKWQDGKPFGPWDWARDTPPGSAEPTEADRWRELIGQRLRACEDAKSLFERWSGRIADHLSDLKDSLLLILLPPFGLLLLGCCIGWVAK